MTKADVDAVGRGRVWTGQQAFERHLVDHLGGMREALEAARAAGAPARTTRPSSSCPPRERRRCSSRRSARRAPAGVDDRAAQRSSRCRPPCGARPRRRAAGRLPERRAARADGVGRRRRVAGRGGTTWGTRSLRRRRRLGVSPAGGCGGLRPSTTARCSRRQAAAETWRRTQERPAPSDSPRRLPLLRSESVDDGLLAVDMAPAHALPRGRACVRGRRHRRGETGVRPRETAPSEAETGMRQTETAPSERETGMRQTETAPSERETGLRQTETAPSERGDGPASDRDGTV